MTDDPQDLIALTADIVAAHVGHNRVAVADVPALIQTVYEALASTAAPAPSAKAEKLVGAVSVRASIKPDRLISMIDGKPYKMLARHIARHGYTPATYRAAFGLPIDYPMVATDQTEKRRETALRLGLGRKPRQGTVASDPVSVGPAVSDEAEPSPLDADVGGDDSSAEQEAESVGAPKAGRKRLKLTM